MYVQYNTLQYSTRNRRMLKLTLRKFKHKDIRIKISCTSCIFNKYRYVSNIYDRIVGLTCANSFKMNQFGGLVEDKFGRPIF